MKSSLFFILTTIILSSGCKDSEIQTRDYPFVETNEVTEIVPGSVIFNAKLLNAGNEDIIDFGFTWNDGKQVFKESIFHSGTLDHFQLKVTSDLGQGIISSVKAYIITSKHLIYGNSISFISKGSTSPEIIGFYPQSGYPGAIVTLWGKNFSHHIDNIKIYVNNLISKILTTTSDSIQFIIPLNNTLEESKIKLISNGDTLLLKSEFNIFSPTIKSISSHNGIPGDTLLIIAENIVFDSFSVTVLFDKVQSEILKKSSDTLLVRIPFVPGNLLFDFNVLLTISIPGSNLNFMDNFKINKTWSQKAAPPFNKSYNYESFTYNELGYILELNSGKLYQYKPDLNVWNVYSNNVFPGEIYDGSLSVVSENNFYKVGGRTTGNVAINELWSFNFDSKIWIQQENLPFSFTYAINFKISDKDYILTNKEELWECDFKNQKYLKKSTVPFTIKYGFASTFYKNSNLFVVINGLTWQYKFESDEWVNIYTNPFNSNIYTQNPVGFGVNNTGYVLYKGTDLYKYEVSCGNWLLISKYPGIRGDVSYKTVFVIKNKVYFAVTSSTYSDAAPYMYMYEE